MKVLDQVKTGDNRLRTVALAMLGGMMILLVGLWYVQVVSRGKYQNSLKIQSFRNVRLPAARGKIVDRNGELLAENEPRYVINLYLEDLRKEFQYMYTNSVRQEFLARMKRKPNSKELPALGDDARYRVVSNIVWKISSQILPQPLILNSNAFVSHYRKQLAMPLPIVSDLTPQQIALFVEKSSNLPGIELEVEPFRYYPYHETAAHVIGYVQQDAQVEEETEESEYSFRYSLPEYRGQTGIERGHDKELKGTAGGKSLLVNNLGYRQKEEVWLQPEPGDDISLTLDLGLQLVVEKALKASGPATRGAAVVLDCQTGDILAIASAPAYDLNMFIRSAASGASHDDWERLNDPFLTPQYNRALQGTYPPGSIFKIVVGLAALEAGVVTETDQLQTAGYSMIHGRRIADLCPAGVYDFKGAFKRSSNCYFIEYGLRAGLQRILEMGRQFDLGQASGVVLPAQEKKGYFPTPGDHVKKKDGTRWMEGDSANLCIGQGEILVTPLQMAVMTAAVANGGKVLRPRLVAKVSEAGSKAGIGALKPLLARTLNVQAKNLEIVRRSMLADVEEGGTGKEVRIEGMRICGKTGTAQIADGHGKIDHITWFASFTPFESPKYVVLVMVEADREEYGGTLCVPKAKMIYKAIQKMEREGEHRNMASR